MATKALVSCRRSLGENVAQLDLVQGKRFEARQKPFAEFELSSANERILRIVYADNPKLEELGGCAYRCEYQSRTWELQTFQTPLLGRESYRVLCEGQLIASTGAWKMFRPVEIKYSDGLIWHGRRRLFFGTVVDNQAGRRIIHSWPQPGLLFAGSSIWLDSLEAEDQTLALLLVLLHLTTHANG